MTINVQRYKAVQEDDGSWSVIDAPTELAVHLSEEPMVLLQERFAKALAEFLNLEEQHNGTVRIQ